MFMKGILNLCITALKQCKKIKCDRNQGEWKLNAVIPKIECNDPQNLKLSENLVNSGILTFIF